MVFTVSVHSQLGGTPAMGGAVGGMSSRLGGEGAGGGAGPVYGPVPSPAPLSPALHQPTDNNIIPQLQNIVSTVNMGVKLDLKKIALHARNAEFNPKRFAAVIMRIREPRTTALIFSSGKMVCTGAKSEEDSRLAARKYARIVQKLGFPTKFKDFKIQNMVTTHGGNALNDSHTFTSSGWLVRRQVPDPSGGFGADPLPVLQLRTRAVPWPHLQV